MTSVRFFPVAEQYPSSTATSSESTSTRNSVIGTLGGQAAGDSGVQRDKRVTFRPFRLRHFAAAQLRKRANSYANFISNLRLGKPMLFDFDNDLIPVHDDSFSTSRNTSIRQVETQVMENQMMSTLAERLIEARTDLGWKPSDLKREAKIKSPSTISEIESGKRTKSPQLPIIAATLGVSVMWLQHGKGPKYLNTIEGTSRRVEESAQNPRRPQQSLSNRHVTSR